MEVTHRRCAGLDVHKDTVVACARLVGDDGQVALELGEFGTTTTELFRLGEWLSEHGCTHAAMEATGVYWKPVWHVLEGSIELMLVNARHFRNVPGRKTDVNDATWLAELLAHGLLRASFVPPAPQQEIRDLTRTRKTLVREQSRHIQRLQKTLEDANIKLASVVSNIVGKTGRAMLEAIAAGHDDPEALLRFKQRGIKASDSELIEALRGHVTDQHRFDLRLHLDLIDALDRALAAVDARLEASLGPFREATALLVGIPGVGRTVAESLVGEIGTDMTRFPTAAHLRSWVRVCPRSDVSAGKHRSTRVQKGGVWLKPLLVGAAWSAVRKKDGYFRALFHRIKSRRGAKKAIVAVAAAILTTAYNLLRTGATYADLGGDHFDRTEKHRAVQRHVRRLNQLGYSVDLAPAV